MGAYRIIIGDNRNARDRRIHREIRSTARETSVSRYVTCLCLPSLSSVKFHIKLNRVSCDPSTCINCLPRSAIQVPSGPLKRSPQPSRRPEYLILQLLVSCSSVGHLPPSRVAREAPLSPFELRNLNRQRKRRPWPPDRPCSRGVFRPCRRSRIAAPPR